MIHTDCNAAKLDIESQPESLTEMIVTDAELVLFEYDLSTVVSTTTANPCGEPVIEFITADGDELNADLFIEDRSTEGAYKLIVAETADHTLAGTYEMKYKFYFNKQPSVFIESDIFTLDLVSKCLPRDDSVKPVIIAPEMPDLVYVITADPIYYDIPKWSTEPAYCSDVITFVSDTEVEGAGGAAFEIVDEQLVISYSDSTDLAGEGEEKTYDVNIIASIGDVQGESPFKLTIRNPCFDDEFLSILEDESQRLPDFSYTLFNDTQNSWSPGFYELQSSSDRVRELCGEL